MTHLGQRLSALIDGELDGSERERVLMHLTKCGSCRDEVAALRTLKRRMNAMGETAAGAALTGRLIGLSALANLDREDRSTAGPSAGTGWPEDPGGQRSAGTGWPAQHTAPSAPDPAGCPRPEQRAGRYFLTGSLVIFLAGLGTAAVIAGGEPQPQAPTLPVTPSVDVLVSPHESGNGVGTGGPPAAGPGNCPAASGAHRPDLGPLREITARFPLRSASAGTGVPSPAPARAGSFRVTAGHAPPGSSQGRQMMSAQPGRGTVTPAASSHGYTAISASAPDHWQGRWWQRERLRGWRLAAAVSALAVGCTALGGLLGGYIAVHTESVQLDPGYSLGPLPPAPSYRPASSVAGVAARVTPGVVMIKVDGGLGTGSGFLIQGGYIVTDNHVVTLDGNAPGASLQVYYSDGSSVAGQLVGRDPYSDIAVIRPAVTTARPFLSLGNSATVAVGDPVLAVGSPLGLADTVTSGIVSAVDRPVQPGAAVGTAPQVFFDAIQTDAPINPGSSGGPLVNSRGQVIGIDAALDTLGSDPITGAQGGSIGLGFAIPVDQARRVIVQLIRTGYATHSVIGAALNNSYSGTGAEIATTAQGGQPAIDPGGPAARAGLQPGDVITKLADLPVATAYSLVDAIRSLAPGSRVGVTFVRQGSTMETNLTLGSARS